MIRRFAGILALLCLFQTASMGDPPGKIPVSSIYTRSTDLLALGSLKLYSISGSLVPSGSVGLWSNGTSLYFRKSDGTDLTLGSAQVQQSGTPLTLRPALNFASRFSCVDNSGSSRTDCDLATTITPGSFTAANITVDAYGRITAAASGSSLPSQSTHAGQFLETDGSNPQWLSITQDMILPGFAITSFSTTSTTSLEIGDTIASPVAFTASYASPAASGSITDGTFSTTLSSPFTSGSLAHSYSKTAPNATQTWTLTAAAATTKTASITATWRARIYYGIATPATIDSTFVNALASNQLASSVGATYSIGAGNNTKKAYLCLPSSLGQPSSFKDGGGFAVPTSQVGTPTVVNGFSVSTAYTCYASDNFLNGSFSWVVN